MPEFSELLAAQRLALLEQLDVSERELVDIRDSRTDATADDEHDPEGSTLSGDWSRVSGMRSDARERLAATDRAIDRLRTGTYGMCLNCGLPIDPDRLEARPAAELCIVCARAA